MKLIYIWVYLEQEESAAGFMGVNFESDEEIGLLEMKQPGLINRFINDVLIFYGKAKGKYTPAGSVPLFNN